MSFQTSASSRWDPVGKVSPSVQSTGKGSEQLSRPALLQKWIFCRDSLKIRSSLEQGGLIPGEEQGAAAAEGPEGRTPQVQTSHQELSMDLDSKRCKAFTGKIEKKISPEPSLSFHANPNLTCNVSSKQHYTDGTEFMRDVLCLTK